MLVLPVEEGPPEYYDKAFNGVKYPNFCLLYNWAIQALIRYRRGKLFIKNPPPPKLPYLDIGCGMGRLSTVAYFGHNILIDGLDFSTFGINNVKDYLKHVKFYCEDVWKFDKYNDYNVFIATEFLEHVKEDIKFFSLLPKGSLFVFTVPSPAWGDNHHLRYFESISDVVNRYKDVLDFIEVKIVSPGPAYGGIGIVK